MSQRGATVCACDVLVLCAPDVTYISTYWFVEIMDTVGTDCTSAITEVQEYITQAMLLNNVAFSHTLQQISFC